MKYYVYILFSSVSGKYYVGQTNNLESRIERHNSGYVRSTKNHLPWRLIISYECCTRNEAMQLESKIRKRGIARYLKDNNFFGM
jgi:putative endonuclease